MLNCIQLNTIHFVRVRYLIIINKNVFISTVNCLPHGERTVLFSLHFVSIPGLIFVISILLFLFVSASEGTQAYISLPLAANLCKSQEVSQSCMKSKVDTQLLNMLHTHQQHTVAIYISACAMWHKGTSVYISYCQLQQVTQPHCSNWLTSTKPTNFLRTVSSVRTWNYRKIRPVAADIQPRIYKNYLTYWLTCWLTIRQNEWMADWLNKWMTLYLLTDCLTDEMTDWLTKWLAI